MSENTNPYGAPQPAPKKKSWFARHKFLTGLGAVVLIGAAASALGEEGTSSTPSSASAGVTAGTTEDATAAATTADESAPTDAGSPDGSQATESGESAPAGLGQPVQVGDFEVTVTGVEPGIMSVGPDGLAEEPQGQYVMVSVSVTNLANGAETFWANDQKLIDDQGREHSYSTDGWLVEGGQVLLEEINPGNTLQGVLLYDIPADAVPQMLRVSGGMFAGDTEIALQ